MGNSVIGSSTASLTRAFGVSTAGNFSAVMAVKYQAASTGNFPSPFDAQNGSSQSFWSTFQADPSNGDNVLVEYKVGTTNTDTSIGANSSIANHWLHLAFTYNHSTGAQNIYALLEGFNPGSPSFLITPSVGNSSIGLPTSLFVYTDSGGGVDTFAGKLGHLIITPLELTQAQVLAQFAQRAPTATVTGGGSYTYLACTSAANVNVDAGTLASNFTKSGTFTDDASDQPSEWNPITVSDAAGLLAAQRIARNTLLRM